MIFDSINTCAQLGEIVYAKWDESKLYYLGTVTSVDPDKKTYSVDYMDGYSKSDIPQKEIRKVPAREKKNKPIGKTFFDSGDYVPGRKKTRDGFKPGEFTVLCYQSGRNPTYWCERLTNKPDNGKREFVEFFCSWVHQMIEKYDKE